jgi:hypothetical protein
MCAVQTKSEMGADSAVLSGRKVSISHDITWERAGNLLRVFQLASSSMTSLVLGLTKWISCCSTVMLYLLAWFEKHRRRISV